MVALFSIKNKSVFKSEVERDGLIYSKDTIGSLVGKDTDLDGVPDWEEFLWGTDPRKGDTDGDGVGDKEEIASLRAKKQGESGLSLSGDDVRLTETDKFSREFFATISSLNQSGSLDQETIEKLGEALSDKIQNSEPRKVFTVADIKIKKGGLRQDIVNYEKALKNIPVGTPVGYTVLDVLQRFMVDEDTIDVEVLSELDPIIVQTSRIIDEILKIDVPESLVSPHLGFVNATERLLENTSDIQLYDTDAIVALSAISQYVDNGEILEAAVANLNSAIQNKLSN